MSKFFRGAVASESESESESSDEAPQTARPAAARPKFAASESEEDEKRIVRAAKDKRFDELKDLIKALSIAKREKDMRKLTSVFDDLTRVFTKSKSVIEKEGGFTPRFYLRSLNELDDYISENWENREERKNMSKDNARALTTLRQKLKKYTKDFEAELAEYRENPDPDGFSAEEVSESESESDDDKEDLKPVVGTKRDSDKRRGAQDRDESDEDEDSEWEESTSEDSDLEDLTGKKLEELRTFFLKTSAKDDDKVKKKTDRKKRREDRERPAARDEDEGEWQAVTGGATVPAERPKMFEKDTDITTEKVHKKLDELMASRGKKGTDRRALMEAFKELLSIAEAHNFGVPIYCKIYFGLIATLFDYNPKTNDCLSNTSFTNALAYINKVLQMLTQNPQIFCSEHVADEDENLFDTTKQLKIRGCLLSVTERLDDEFTKVLQDADCHSNDYVEKLKREKTVYSLILDIQTYLESRSSTPEELCRIYMRRVDHLYFKFDRTSADKINIPNGTDKALEPTTETPSRDVIQKLCTYIYANDTTKRLRARAMLCQIYHHALHGRWHEARDLVLMSHLQGTIDHSDISTQILYNRTICQLGLCAFRHGYIREAHNALSDIQNGGKAKELLSQGVILRSQDRTPEQEKIERQRQIPYHMHINLELLECVYLICAMLLEIPQVASKEFEVRRRLISRSFHYQLRQSERQSLIGPPENTREHVVAASRALLNGDWQACRNFIVNEKMTAKVWNLFHDSEKVQEMVIRRIQEECLRTYLFAYSSLYDSISLISLADMFQLEKKSVHAIISKMIIQEELSASLDEPAECVVMHRVEPTRLQALSMQLTEKLNHLAENVEQIMESRSGGGQGFAYRQNWGQRQNADQQKQDEYGGSNRQNRRHGQGHGQGQGHGHGQGQGHGHGHGQGQGHGQGHGHGHGHEGGRGKRQYQRNYNN